MSPRVSIVLPTLNGIDTLPGVLDRIRAQRFEPAVEIVAVDSGSTDGTRELLAERIDRVLEVPPERFDHGLTRNLGVGEAGGEWIVMMVQDAEPVGDRWLEELVDPLRDDPRVAGSWCRQRPRPAASPLTRHYLAGWLGASETRRVSEVADRESFQRLSPRERFELCAFDDVCSCLRRSVWEEIPFPATPIAEDLAWSRAALLAGHRLVYTPSAEVLHSHERSARYELRRTRLVHRELGRLFGLRTLPTFGSLMRAVTSTVPLHLRLLGDDPRRLTSLPRYLALAFAWPLGQYLGGRHATSPLSDRPI